MFSGWDCQKVHTSFCILMIIVSHPSCNGRLWLSFRLAKNTCFFAIRQQCAMKMLLLTVLQVFVIIEHNGRGCMLVLCEINSWITCSLGYRHDNNRGGQVPQNFTGSTSTSGDCRRGCRGPGGPHHHHTKWSMPAPHPHWRPPAGKSSH